MAYEPITYYNGEGTLSFRGRYGAAVARLCELEDQRKPPERYTFRLNDGEPAPRRGIELVLGRLYEYEHSGPVKCSQCGTQIERVKPCGYNPRFGPVCDDCCEECFQNDPFPCREHEARKQEAEGRSNGE